MIYPKINLAQAIIEICLQHNIENIVISPGSRNAPLTIGFANNPNFKCYSVVDERCAGFFALGIAQQTRKPVVVICTSGSALLNYYPAFAEAFYSQIPLVVISADRPISKIDIGDGQTIRQQNVFENHSLFNANLTEEAFIENQYSIHQAIYQAITFLGPVHINAPFEEPLYETTDERFIVNDLNFKSFEYNDFDFSEINLKVWNNAKKIMILVGEYFPETLNAKIINTLAEQNAIVVLTECTSNLHHNNFISNIDAIITPFSDSDFEAFRPDLLITFGGMVVSKRIKTFLRKYKPENHWHIDKFRAYDTYDALTAHYKTDANTFFEYIFENQTHKSSNYSEICNKIKTFRKQKHNEYFEKIPFSDFKVFDVINQHLPKNSQLQISNSSAIRYAQLFDIDETITVFCNRGTSGIDGSTSTAIGAAVGSLKPTILIAGDIGFFYDSNALWNNYIPKNFKIILLNNGGGGIFRILPGHSENQVFNTFFETQHQLTAEHLAKMYGFAYETANDEKTLNTGLTNMFSNNEKPFLLEVFTPTKLNDSVLLQYFKALN